MKDAARGCIRFVDICQNLTCSRRNVLLTMTANLPAPRRLVYPFLQLLLEVFVEVLLKMRFCSMTIVLVLLHLVRQHREEAQLRKEHPKKPREQN